MGSNAHIYLSNRISEDKKFNVNFLLKYENIRDRIVPRLVSSENNEAYLENIPHREMDGLAVVYYLPVTEFDDKVGKASMCIHNELLERWKITEEMLYKAAMENLKVNMETKFQSMREVLLETDNIPDVGMYILTNRENFFGASMILNHNVMDDIVERIGEFYILPSSVHETILVKKDCGPSLEYLEEMVREVNRQKVIEDERLSEHVFLYDKRTKEIYRADHEEEHRKQVAETEKNSDEQRTMCTPYMHRGR